MLSDYCIYTIRHSDDLREARKKGGKYTERKRWVQGKLLLEAAQREGKRLPIVFAPAVSNRRTLRMGGAGHNRHRRRRNDILIFGVEAAKGPSQDKPKEKTERQPAEPRVHSSVRYLQDSSLSEKLNPLCAG